MFVFVKRHLHGVNPLPLNITAHTTPLWFVECRFLTTNVFRARRMSSRKLYFSVSISAAVRGNTAEANTDWGMLALCAAAI